MSGFSPQRSASSQLFTADGTFTVPAGVTLLRATYCGGGGGGGGGHATGGAGGGGGGGTWVDAQDVPVSPGAELTITVGAKGTGGAVGSAGTSGEHTTIAGALITLPAAWGGSRGGAGAATNGGNGGSSGYDEAVQSSGAIPVAINGPAGDADGGALAIAAPAASSVGNISNIGYGTTGGAGAGTGGGGGGSGRSFTTTRPEGGADIGGGAGGCTKYGNGGTGGASSAVGSNAAGNGAGGGGGGQNAAGGNGSDGFVLLIW